MGLMIKKVAISGVIFSVWNCLWSIGSLAMEYKSDLESFERGSMDLSQEEREKKLLEIAELERAAQKEDGQALHAFGDAYYWLVSRAMVMVNSAGHTSGPRYNNKKFATENFKKAFRLYERAAMLNYVPSQLALGNMYAEGHGIDKDYQKAFYWFNELAQKGIDDGQYNIALCYCHGWGVTQDYKQGYYWLNKLAQKGSAKAQYNLGVCFYNGWGVEQDENQAIYWIKQAAHQGHEEAKNVYASLIDENDIF